MKIYIKKIDSFHKNGRYVEHIFIKEQRLLVYIYINTSGLRFFNLELLIFGLNGVSALISACNFFCLIF